MSENRFDWFALLAGIALCFICLIPSCEVFGKCYTMADGSVVCDKPVSTVVREVVRPRATVTTTRVRDVPQYQPARTVQYYHQPSRVVSTTSSKITSSKMPMFSGDGPVRRLLANRRANAQARQQARSTSAVQYRAPVQYVESMNYETPVMYYESMPEFVSSSSVQYQGYSGSSVDIDELEANAIRSIQELANYIRATNGRPAATTQPPTSTPDSDQDKPAPPVEKIYVPTFKQSQVVPVPTKKLVCSVPPIKTVKVPSVQREVYFAKR